MGSKERKCHLTTRNEVRSEGPLTSSDELQGLIPWHRSSSEPEEEMQNTAEWVWCPRKVEAVQCCAYTHSILTKGTVQTSLQGALETSRRCVPLPEGSTLSGGLNHRPDPISLAVQFLICAVADPIKSFPKWNHFVFILQVDFPSPLFRDGSRGSRALSIKKKF